MEAAYARRPRSVGRASPQCNPLRERGKCLFHHVPAGLLAVGCWVTRSCDHTVLGDGVEIGGGSPGTALKKPRALSTRQNCCQECPLLDCMCETNKRSNVLTSLFGSCGTFRIPPPWHDKREPEIGKRIQ